MPRTSTENISTKLSVDHSSRFPFRVQTKKQTDAHTSKSQTPVITLCSFSCSSYHRPPARV